MRYPLQSDDAGKLILRLTVGGLILFHSVSKILNPSGAMGMIHFSGIRATIRCWEGPGWMLCWAEAGTIQWTAAPAQISCRPGRAWTCSIIPAARCR